jgi:rod shape-determining protein MreD
MTEQRPKIEQRIWQQIVYALTMLAVALVQTSLAPTIWRFRIDWVLLVVVGWLLLRGLIAGLTLAIYGGLALDLLGSLAVGSHLLGLLLAVAAVALITEPLDREQPLLMIACLLGAALLYNVTLATILVATGKALPLASHALVVILPVALLDAIVGVPTLALLRRVRQRHQTIVEA